MCAHRLVDSLRNVRTQRINTLTRLIFDVLVSARGKLVNLYRGEKWHLTRGKCKCFQSRSWDTQAYRRVPRSKYPSLFSLSTSVTRYVSQCNVNTAGVTVFQAAAGKPAPASSRIGQNYLAETQHDCAAKNRVFIH